MLKIKVGSNPFADGYFKLEGRNVSNKPHKARLIFTLKNRHHNRQENFHLSFKFLHFHEIDFDFIDLVFRYLTSTTDSTITTSPPSSLSLETSLNATAPAGYKSNANLLLQFSQCMEDRNQDPDRYQTTSRSHVLLIKGGGKVCNPRSTLNHLYITYSKYNVNAG